MARFIDIHSHATDGNGRGVLTVRSISINQNCRGKDFREENLELREQGHCLLSEQVHCLFSEQGHCLFSEQGHGSHDADLGESIYSIGVYPFDALESCQKWFETIALVASDERVWAIGEVGLDYREPYRSFAKIQMDVFMRQIQIANRLGKPLMIHQVRAIDDVLSALRDASVPAIFHGFSGSAESATRIVSAGFYISFGHLLLRNEKIQKILTTLSPEKIFFETDQSEIPIEKIYCKAAEIKGVTVDELSEQIEQNFRDVTRLARENRAAVG